MSAFDPSTIDWRHPWIPIDDPAPAQRELKREAPQGHILFGRSPITIARRVDCDDYLFLLHEDPPRFAVVHLTYKIETDPNWPAAEIFNTIEDWIQTRMLPDAANLNP